MSYHIMKVNSSTFLCSLPHLRPSTAEEENATSLTRSEEENERLRARKKGWELLHPLEGNCMFFVSNLLRANAEHWLVDVRSLP
jgi:hypothetical protein